MGQKRMAHLLNHTDNSQYSKWERGKKQPSITNALKLAYILNVPVEVLYADVYQAGIKEVDERAKALFSSEDEEDEDKVSTQPSTKVEHTSSHV